MADLTLTDVKQPITLAGEESGGDNAPASTPPNAEGQCADGYMLMDLPRTSFFSEPGKVCIRNDLAEKYQQAVTANPISDAIGQGFKNIISGLKIPQIMIVLVGLGLVFLALRAFLSDQLDITGLLGKLGKK